MSKTLGTHLGTALGTRLGTNLAPGVQPAWAGFEDKLIFAFDSRFGVTTDTGVSLWSDQSSNGNDIEQAVASAQPAYVEGSIPYLDFDGTDDELTGAIGGGLIPAGQDCTFFVVYRPNDVNNSGFLFETAETAGTTVTGYHYYDQGVTSPGVRNLFYRAVETWTGLMHQVIYNYAVETEEILVATLVTNSTTSTTGWVNGTNAGTDTSPTIEVDAQVEMTLGRRYAATELFGGRVYAFFAINETLSNSDRELIESRLYDWLGITP